MRYKFIQNKFKKNTMAVIAIFTAVLLSAQQAAAVSLEFIAPAGGGGTLSYGGNDGQDVLVGTNITFNEIIGIDTFLNDGVSLTIQGGRLDFETGANISEANRLDGEWIFAGGGSFMLTGTAIDGGGNIVADGQLITGTFDGDQSVKVGSPLSRFDSFGIDTKHQGLLDFYGITDNNFEFASTQVAATGIGFSSDGSFSGNVVEATLVNTSSVPSEGATHLMLSMSLLCLGFVHRQFLKRSN